MDQILRDLRFTWRSWARRPVIAAAVLASVALGIGANTAIFSLVSATLLHRLPIAEPDRVVELFTTSPKARYGSFSYPELVDYREQDGVFEGLAAFTMAQVSFNNGERSDLVWGSLVSGNYFDVLGVRAEAGRFFLEEEGLTPGADPVAVLAHRFRPRRLGGAPDVVGSTVTLNGRAFEVVGVAPASFTGTVVGFSPEFWVPITMAEVIKPGAGFLTSREGRSLQAIGRLAPGISLSKAAAAVRTVASRLESTYPDTNREVGATVMPAGPVHPEFRGAVAGFLALLMTVVGLLLLVACANVTNLLLAKAAERQRETAIRLSLGASRARLVGQLFTESVALAIVAGGFGCLVGYWLSRLITNLDLPLPFPIELDLGLDPTVLAFAVGLSVATGLLFGLVPAFVASRPDLVAVLKGEGRPSATRGRRFRIANLLVVAQVAVSLILLIGAGLLLRSLGKVDEVNPGFDTDRVLAAVIGLEIHGYTQTRGEEFFRRLSDDISTLPGVEAVSFASHLPLGFEIRLETIATEDFPEAGSKNGATRIDTSLIDPGYFQTLGITLLRGRDFAVADDSQARRVAIVNEAFAERFWPGQDPIGRSLRLTRFDPPEVEIIGVVATGKYRGLGEKARPFLYLPFSQHYESYRTFLVRTARDPGSLVGAVRAEVAKLDPNLPFFEVKTLRQHLGSALFPQRFAAVLLGALGLVGLLMAAVGLYGVMAGAVQRSTREVGIRMALGGDRSSVRALVLKRAMKLVGVGVLLGLLGGAALGSAMAGLLFGIRPFDLPTFLGLGLLVILIAFVASYFPARRATRIEPIVALRYE